MSTRLTTLREPLARVRSQATAAPDATGRTAAHHAALAFVSCLAFQFALASGCAAQSVMVSAYAERLDPAEAVVSKAFSECASDRGGEAIVGFRTVGRTVTWTIPPPVTGAIRACLDARIGDAELPQGEHVLRVTWTARDSDVPTFPYPLPRASGAARLKAMERDDEGRSLERVSTEIEKALENAGYLGPLWYPFLDGVAVVTAPEKVDETGKPRCLPGSGCNRFATDFQKDFRVTETALGLFWRTELRYRLFAFLIATGEIRYQANPTPVEDAQPPDGYATLPDWVRSLRTDRPFRVHAVMYLYTRKEAGQPAVLLKSQDVRANLKAAGLQALL